jgi:amino acid transporter
MPEHEAMAGDSVTSLDADETRLHELGYEQELKRALHAFDNVAMGFTAISPVVALYGVVGVGLVLAGPAWVWVLPVALAGQCLVLVVYAELASEFPVANASYQWSRRLLGPTYGWINGWVCLCAYAAANTTIAYLAAPWALSLLAVEPTPGRIVATGAALIAVCATVSAIGIDTLKAVIAVGISAEVIATVVIGLSLLGLRQQPASILTEGLGAVPPGGSAALAMLAALAVGGWVFIGFDACGQSAEETHDATRHVPRAVWIALLSVGVLVILNAVAIILAHPDPAAVVEGRDLDPVTTAVVSAFGSWSERPLAAVVLAAFVACGMASQNMTARAIFSVSRDGVLPGSALLRRVNARRVPLPAIVLTALLSCGGLLLGLEAAAIGSLIAFGTAGIYATFLLLCVAALVARIRGRWVPSGRLRLGRLGLVCNVLAVLWLVVETINIAWPRPVLAPEGAPWYQVWAAALLLAVIAVVGLGYLLVARPQRRLVDLALDQSTGTPTYAGPWGPHA